MADSATAIKLHVGIPSEMAGKRLDQVASELLPAYSRSRLQQWIKSGELTVNGKARRPRDKVYPGEAIYLDATLEPEGQWCAEGDIDFDVVHEDKALIVINKPAGLVVHPAAGNRRGTLLNGLLARWPELEEVPRAGIVHRLDKDTSGLMVVARNLTAHTSLVRQLQKRSMGREYEAVVSGVMTGGGTVDAPIGRHPRARTKMAVLNTTGSGVAKPAVTHYRVLERFLHHTHIRAKLETGRTHQIRVHMAHIGYPLLGDSLYAGRLQIPRSASSQLQQQLRNFRRQALHAKELTLVHPHTHETCVWQAPVPEDMQQLLDVLREDTKSNG